MSDQIPPCPSAIQPHKCSSIPSALARAGARRVLQLLARAVEVAVVVVIVVVVIVVVVAVVVVAKAVTIR